MPHSAPKFLSDNMQRVIPNVSSRIRLKSSAERIPRDEEWVTLRSSRFAVLRPASLRCVSGCITRGHPGAVKTRASERDFRTAPASGFPAPGPAARGSDSFGTVPQGPQIPPPHLVPRSRASDGYLSSFSFDFELTLPVLEEIFFVDAFCARKRIGTLQTERWEWTRKIFEILEWTRKIFEILQRITCSLSQFRLEWITGQGTNLSTLLHVS